MTTKTKCLREAGFSLVEVLVAMVITLIISGAVFGLMASGQDAFQREPALTDRQQNARIALDLIETDLANAGRGMPLVSQVFTDLLDDTGVTNDRGTLTDVLEMIIADPRCQAQSLCTGANTTAAPTLASLGGAGTYRTNEPNPTGPDIAACVKAPILLAGEFGFSVHMPTAPVPAAGVACPTSGDATRNGGMTLPVVAPGRFNTWAAAPRVGANVAMYSAQVVRYSLQMEAGELSLIRSDGVAPAQTVARGIDELQVRYLTGLGWATNAGAVPPCVATTCTIAEYNAVVRNVEVTLWARTTVGNMQQGADAGAIKVVRAPLVTVVAPRAAVVTLEAAFHETGTITFN